MRSMTGYGKGQSNKAGLNLIAEVKTVNHRYLDVSVRLQRSLTALEIPLRKRLTERFTRGRIELSFTQDVSGTPATLVRANLPLAHEYTQAAEQVAQAAGLKSNLKLNTLLSLPEVLTLIPLEMEAEVMQEAAMEALDLACEAVWPTGCGRGTAAAVFLVHLDVLEDTITQLKEAAPAAGTGPEKLQNALSTMPDLAVDPQRLAQEIALFADRCDITERSTASAPIARRCGSWSPRKRRSGGMDFLAQEMNRRPTPSAASPPPSQSPSWG